MTYALGVDIGGTKVATVLINEKGEQLFRSEVKSNQVNREKMFDQVIKSIESVLDKSSILKSDIQGIGVGVPGKVDRKNGIAVFQGNLPWRNFPIAQRLNEYFSVDKIVVDNDVHMATFAEWKLKNDKSETFVYMTVSTGISCAIIHQGSFLRGNGFAGEVGLFPVRSFASPNKFNRLEESASGPTIGRIASEKFNQTKILTKEVFQKYDEGDKTAEMIVNGVVESLAHGIYSIICLIDPHKIVFGGGVINNNPHIVSLIKKSLKQYLIPEQENVLERLQISHYKENAGAIGAGLNGLRREKSHLQ